MAQHQIARSCGHTETVQLYGPSRDRDRKQRWLQGRSCTACFKAARDGEREALAKRAEHIAGLNGWPHLSGSPRQVQWAQDLRMTALARLIQLATAAFGDRDEVVHTVTQAVLRQTDAAWWIDRRGLWREIRGLLDLLDEEGAARYTYGHPLGAVLTSDELQQLRQPHHG